jgi:hypothetical protein
MLAPAGLQVEARGVRMVTALGILARGATWLPLLP